MKNYYLSILRKLLSVPTVPFHEEAVAGQVESWAQATGIDASRDKAGNVVLRYCRGKSKTPKVLAAHMDHPGFVAVAAKGTDLRAEFMGNVRPEYFPGSRVRFFGADGDVIATVVSAKMSDKSPFLQCRLQMNKAVAVPAGTIGMWDLPAMRVRGHRLSSRGVDDVVGSAAVLCAMEAIARSKMNTHVIGLLTRAEEVGFIGAIGACEHGTIPKDSLIVAIETSKAQPTAPLGAGAVVRIGDAARTFDPSLTAHVTAIAADLAKRDADFRYVRQLMPGGVCESTVYMMLGYAATGMCLPLDNYHNQGRRGRIAAEAVDLRDFESLVKLLVAFAADRGSVQQTDDKLRQRLRDLLKSRGGYL